MVWVMVCARGGYDLPLWGLWSGCLGSETHENATGGYDQVMVWVMVWVMVCVLSPGLDTTRYRTRHNSKPEMAPIETRKTQLPRTIPVPQTITKTITPPDHNPPRP